MAKILIVDDAAFMRKVIRDTLTKNGFTDLHEAVDGKDAVEKYFELQPDLVLMDITMPNMDGLEALKAIGLAYGLYSRAEELRGQRVHLTGGEGHTALVVQEDFSCHGSPCWETVRTLTEDPAEIQQYMAFRDVLRIVQQRDREERLPAKQRTGDSFPEHPPRQGGRSRER